MAESSAATVAVDSSVEIGVYVAGIVAAALAAYHTGQTGNWWPLAVVSMGLCIAVIIFDSE